MRRGIGRGGLAVLAALAVCADPAAAIEQPTREDCSVANASATARAPKRPYKPAVKLQAEPGSQARIVNFGDDRDEEFQRFTLIAEPALPKNAEKRLSLVADVMTRTGSDTAETVTFPDATFTPIVVYGNRKRLTFGVCLKPPSDLPAGKYTGLISTDGPAGIEGTAVSITANAKDSRGFKAGALLALFIAFVVLLYKGASDTRAQRIEAAKNETDAEAKKQASSYRRAAGAQLSDFGWLASTAAALAATFLALYALWEADPAWGEAGLVASAAALVAAGLAAVGAKTVITPSGNPPK
jgi:hypothetical protein